MYPDNRLSKGENIAGNPESLAKSVVTGHEQNSSSQRSSGYSSMSFDQHESAETQPRDLPITLSELPHNSAILVQKPEGVAAPIELVTVAGTIIASGTYVQVAFAMCKINHCKTLVHTCIFQIQYFYQEVHLNHSLFRVSPQVPRMILCLLLFLQVKTCRVAN